MFGCSESPKGVLEVTNLGFTKGSWMFSVNGREVSTGEKGSFRKLCRKLIKEGYNPQEIVQMYTKEGTACWEKERSLIEWAEEVLTESEAKGFMPVKGFPREEWAFSVPTYGQK